MRLIYNCGRLQAKGYATFLGASGKAGIAAPEPDQLWKAVERGEPRPGSTGIVRRLSAEGREIVEVLVLDHGRMLSAAQTTALQASLGRFFDRDLAAALKEANAPEVGHAAAQAMINAALTSALPALAQPISSARPVAAPAQKVAAPRRHWRAIGGVAALVVLSVGLLAWFGLSRAEGPSTPQEPIAPSEETTAAVQDFLRACHGEPDPALVADLAASFAELAPLAHVDGKRDRLQLVAPSDRESLPDLAASTDADICAKRQALWQMLEALRPHMGTTSTLPYQDALTDLAIPTEELALPKLAQTASQATPPPAGPADCARGKCFPILHPADLVALNWINGLYRTLAAELLATADNPTREHGLPAGLQAQSGELRAAEVRFRGELALADITTNHPDWLKQLWDCAGRDHLKTCSFPLAEASVWARR